MGKGRTETTAARATKAEGGEGLPEAAAALWACELPRKGPGEPTTGKYIQETHLWSHSQFQGLCPDGTAGPLEWPGRGKTLEDWPLAWHFSHTSAASSRFQRLNFIV